MIKKQKEEMVRTLKPMFESTHLYIVDCEGLKANQMYNFRYVLFEAGIPCRQVPNALLHILFKGTAYTGLLEVLRQNSILLFVKEDVKKPAQIIKAFRKKQKTKKPLLKGAWAHEELFIGEKSLEELVKLKSREELIADIVRLLQSPAQQLLNAINSGQDKLCHTIKTIQEK